MFQAREPQESLWQSEFLITLRNQVDPIVRTAVRLK